MTTTTDPVVVERAEGVATVRLNRPDAMNSLDTATKEALLAAVREVAQDPQVRAVVLTGTGRAFCVGQDLREHTALLDSGSDDLLATVRDHYNPLVTLLARMDKPVVAAINGVAAGAGMSLALAADLRVMSEDAGFNTAFTGIALSCDTGISWHLPRLVGAARATELLLMPRTVPAAEALELGLVNRVVPAGELGATVADLAGRLAQGPTVAYAAVRAAVRFSLAHDLEESLVHEGELMDRTGRTQDHATAVRAFLAKERPVFEGR